MGAYYNTTNMSDTALFEAMSNAKRQQDKVLAIFRVSRREMSPPEVMRVYNLFNPEVPITSIRRSMTDLTKEGVLVKTQKKVTGDYGKPNYKWILA